MGPQNAVMGDAGDNPLAEPQTQVPEQDISRERNMAKFSQTKEFQALKETILSRIEFWKKYHPSGDGRNLALRDLTNEERGWRTLVSDYLIEELHSIIQAYESASEVVRNAQKAKR